MVAAWLVPLTILPSCVWRVTELWTADDLFSGGVRHRLVDDGGWYLIVLSGLSLGFGLLTSGLVQRWGEIVPRWIPVVGGRRVPVRAATGAAITGACLVMAIFLYGTLNYAFGWVEQGPVLTGRASGDHAPPGAGVAVLYLPLGAWGPLLVAVALNYRRRRAAATRGGSGAMGHEATSAA